MLLHNLPHRRLIGPDEPGIGIHGQPRLAWPRDATAIREGPYCHHSLPTFVPWHRVYLLAYEVGILGC